MTWYVAYGAEQLQQLQIPDHWQESRQLHNRQLKVQSSG